MFGATSSSRPGLSVTSTPYGGKSSYWPSTLVARKASSVPVCAPVTLEPTASPTGDEVVRRSCSLSISGSSTVRKPAALALIQPGAVDDDDGLAGSVVGRRVQPGEGGDVTVRLRGVRPEVGDGLPGLVGADVGAGLDQPDAGRHGEVPVDHGGGFHRLTVRSRERAGSGAHERMPVVRPVSAHVDGRVRP